MKQLIKSVLAVMNEVKGIDKSMTVGSGSYAYKGVSDKDVKMIIGEAMQKHGLVILPTSVTPTARINNWDENGKQKQSVFTEVVTKYMLCHESGESIELQGYGHGTDTQDKSAGKATTYALKYLLLYTFLTPTGSIDDADTTHSEEIPAPKMNGVNRDEATEWLNEGTDEYWKVVKALSSGVREWKDVYKKYKLSKKVRAAIEAEINNEPS